MEMESTDVVMPVSTQDISQLYILGWIDVLDKPPAERVTVVVDVDCQGQYVIGAAAYPGTHYFTYTGRQYFNLSLQLAEDTPPGREYLVDVIASADAKLGFDNAVVHMSVRTVPELSGNAELFEPPKRVPQGGLASGIVEVRNTGTQYAQYLLAVGEDPSDIVEEARFSMEVEIKPDYVEKAPFIVRIDPDTKPGKHTVTLDLLVVSEDGGTTVTDSFEMELTVVEEVEHGFDWYSAAIIALVLITVAFVVALVVRRRR